MHQMPPSQSEPSYLWSYEAHRRQQIRRGLELSVVERLQWLETTMAEMQSVVGRTSGEVPAGLERQSGPAAEPTLEGAFSDDGVDLTLIRWMLQRSPTERLQAAQDLIDATWALRSESEA